MVIILLTYMLYNIHDNFTNFISSNKTIKANDKTVLTFRSSHDSIIKANIYKIMQITAIKSDFGAKN